MEVSFDTKSLRMICESGTKAEHELGIKLARSLVRRLADLRAATNASELSAGRPREVEGDGIRLMALDLYGGSCIVFSANHNKVPLVQTGGVDWSKVSRVKIQRIEVNDA